MHSILFLESFNLLIVEFLFLSLLMMLVILSLRGKINGVTGSGLLTIWKVIVQGKDGQTNLNIVKIGLSEDGSRAPVHPYLQFPYNVYSNISILTVSFL